MARHRSCGIARCCSLLALMAFAASAFTPAGWAAATAPPAAAVPGDPLGRDTPHGTVSGFARAMEAGDDDSAVNYLQGPQSVARKRELARQLKAVLDRGAQVRMDDLSRQPEGHLDDGLSDDLESVGTAKLTGGDLPIVLRRVRPRDAQPIWLYSSETLQRVPDATEQLEADWRETIWPAAFRTRQFLSIPLFIWINNLLLAPLLAGLAWLIGRGLRLALRPPMRHWFGDGGAGVQSRLSGAGYWIILGILLQVAGSYGLTIRARLFWGSVGSVLSIAALTWLLVRVTQILTESKARHFRQDGQPERIATVELFCWALVCLWVIAGLIGIMRSLGFDISTTLAGLGVGGIAVAFAAQKSIADLFGTLTVIGDEPVRIGDEVQVGNVHGRVESIGLRSTRIRSEARSVVTIPNGQLATMNVDNLELRDKFLCCHSLRLRHETAPDQLRRVLAQTREMLAAHPKVEPDSVRVRFVGFGESSLDIEVRLHVLVLQKDAFLETQEDLLLRIMDIVAASGTRLAMPSEMTYLAGESNHVG